MSLANFLEGEECRRGGCRDDHFDAVNRVITDGRGRPQLTSKANEVLSPSRASRPAFTPCGMASRFLRYDATSSVASLDEVRESTMGL